MKYKIAVFNTEIMDKKVGEAIEPFRDRCEFTTFYYKQSSEIPEIYRKIEEEYHGFIVNGIISRAILKAAYPDTRKIIETFHMDIHSYYVELLRLLALNENLKVERIYLDFMTGNNMKEAIADGTLEERGLEFCRKIEDLDIQKLQEMRFRLTEDVRKRWEKGNIDLVITRFSTAAEDFQNMGIPCHFVYPGISYMRDVLERLLMRLEMDKMKESLPAVINITSGKQEPQKDELKELALQTGILQFSREYDCDFVLQKRSSIYEVYTSAGVVERITRGFSQCPLKEYLREKADCQVYIGYGIGKDSVKARLEAMNANQEAMMHVSGGSFAIDVQEQLIGPLTGKDKLILDTRPSSVYQKMGEQTGISPLTLQKICAVARQENGEVTAQLLADRLGVTVRAASKYLQKMVASKAAQVTGTKQRKTRGRPELIIQIPEPEE